MIGTKLGPYRITESLGAGGMGEVYRARDERLARDVAIKVLLRAVADNPERMARFEREARALAALTHPNILALYDFGAEGGITYAVTELLEGETLRHRLERERLPWRKSLETAAAIADGLAAAHGKGIIHRDIKPDNIFITTDGRVKVLDFGLARVAEVTHAAEDATTVTDPRTAAGMVLGTVGYMAPEQVRGQPADARSDIFTLGCLLYEMLSGNRAFARDTAAETMAAILKDPAPEVSISGVEITPELNRIVAHCLEKNPGERFQSASDLAFHLRSLLSGAATSRPDPGRLDPVAHPAIPSIAVLPFANLSSDSEQEYFCDGMTEEIITALSKIRGLRVISRNSAMTLKGTGKTTREIGELLNVELVLEGGVRKAGTNLRITAQLIDAATDGHLWAELYVGTLDDIFDIQEKVARSIADALRLKLSPAEQQQLTERQVSDPRVLDCYLRARHELLFFTRDSNEKAKRLLQQGLDTLGEHPLLYVGLALAHYFALEAFLEPHNKALEAATHYTRRVQELDPRYGPVILAKLEKYTGSQLKAIRHMEDVVALHPGEVDTLWYLSWGYSFHAGKAAAGLAVAERLVGIDPLTVANLFTFAGSHWADANFAQALAVFDDMHRREPALRMTNFMRMNMLARLGRIDDACSVAEETVGENAEDAFAKLVTVFKHALLGEREAFLALITGELEDSSWNDSECPEWFAGCFALVNERDRALDWLEHWIDRGSINYPMLAHGDPLLQSLRGEPRFQRLLDRIRPEW